MLTNSLYAIIIIIVFNSTTVFASPAPDPVNGFQNTIQWWQQVEAHRLSVENILQSTYADIERKYGHGSEQTKKAFADYLNYNYPGSQVNTSLSGILFESGMKYHFNSNWSIDEMDHTDGNLKRSCLFGELPRYEVSDGTNYITAVIDANNPAKSHFSRARVQALIVTANNLFSKRAPHSNVYYFGGVLSVISDPLAVIMNDAYLSVDNPSGARMDQYADDMILNEATRNWTLSVAQKLYTDNNASLPGAPNGMNAVTDASANMLKQIIGSNTRNVDVAGASTSQLVADMSAPVLNAMHRLLFVVFGILILLLIVKIILSAKTKINKRGK